MLQFKTEGFVEVNSREIVLPDMQVNGAYMQIFPGIGNDMLHKLAREANPAALRLFFAGQQQNGDKRIAGTG